MSVEKQPGNTARLALRQTVQKECMYATCFVSIQVSRDRSIRNLRGLAGLSSGGLSLTVKEVCLSWIDKQ